jgi:uncharacterized protein YndB with AHSA1/START domain
MAARDSLDLTSDPRSIVGTREFDAPRDLVFSAWTDPTHLAQWWGPNGFTTRTMSFDLRPGGAWRFVMHGPDGRDYQNLINFEEVIRPERIAYSHGGAVDGEPVQFKTAVVLEDLGRRSRIIWRADFPSATERDRLIKEYGAAEGLVQTMARLVDFVSGIGHSGGDDRSQTDGQEQRA